MKVKTIVKLSIVAVIILVAMTSLNNLVETVEKGTYQVKQAAVTGTMSAKMTPGLWMQWFGDIEPFPNQETFFFTSDSSEGGAHDQSVKVRFNDGSGAQISGTLRVIMPTSPTDAIDLVTKRGFKTYMDVEQKLILPTVRNALRMTANLMTARESYSEKRSDFNSHAWNQIENGIYETEEKWETKKDPITGKDVTRKVKVPKVDKNGNAIHQANPLEGTGIRLANFEIKDYVYEGKVKEQIAEQQKAMMAVATARANAEKAKQDALTIEEQGKADVMKAKYEEEQKKIRAVVDAEKVKQVAELNAEKALEVAKFDAKAAEQEKKANILRGQGEAERKKAVLAADGALAQKLETFQSVMGMWAEAYSKRKVPGYMIMSSGGDSKTGGIGGANALDMQNTQFMTTLNAMLANQLGLDMGIAKGAVSQ